MRKHTNFLFVQAYLSFRKITYKWNTTNQIAEVGFNYMCNTMIQRSWPGYNLCFPAFSTRVKTAFKISLANPGLSAWRGRGCTARPSFHHSMHTCKKKNIVSTTNCRRANMFHNWKMSVSFVPVTLLWLVLNAKGKPPSFGRIVTNFPTCGVDI